MKLSVLSFLFLFFFSCGETSSETTDEATSLCDESPSAHLAFTSYLGRTYEGGKVVYAARCKGEWVLKPIVESKSTMGTDVSLALKSNGSPTVVYGAVENDGGSYYAEFSGTSYSLTKVTESGQESYDVNHEIDENDHAHLLFIHNTTKQLQHATNAEGEFSITTVLEGVANVGTDICMRKGTDHKIRALWTPQYGSADFQTALLQGSTWTDISDHEGISFSRETSTQGCDFDQNGKYVVALEQSVTTDRPLELLLGSTESNSAIDLVGSENARSPFAIKAFSDGTTYILHTNKDQKDIQLTIYDGTSSTTTTLATASDKLETVSLDSHAVGGFQAVYSTEDDKTMYFEWNTGDEKIETSEVVAHRAKKIIIKLPKPD